MTPTDTPRRGPLRAAVAAALIASTAVGAAALALSTPAQADSGRTGAAAVSVGRPASAKPNLDEQNFAFVINDIRDQGSKEDPLRTDGCLTGAAKAVARKMEKTDSLQFGNTGKLARQCGYDSVTSISSRKPDLGKVYAFLNRGAARKIITSGDYTDFGVGVTGKFDEMRYWALLIAQPLDEPTETPTATVTPTATSSATATVSPMPSGTPSESPTASPSVTDTATPTENPSVTPTPTQTATETPSQTQGPANPPNATEQRAFEMHSEIRAQNGLPALAHNDCLQKYADQQAQRQADEQRMYHQVLSPIFDDCGFNAAAGENVAYGYTTPEAVMDGWMNSTGHRANILRTSFTHVAVGLAYSSDGTPYWAAVFGGMR